MFGQRELEQLLHPPLARRTVANAELVVAYMRHGGCLDTCLRCLLQLPRLAHRAEFIVQCCSEPPFTHAKVACAREYVPHLNKPPRLLVEDLAYALRFSPEVAVPIMGLLTRIAPQDDAIVLPCVLRCLYRPYLLTVRTAAARALCVLCSDSTWLVPHVMAIVELVSNGLVPHVTAPVELLQRMPERAVHAIPALVNRGLTCDDSVKLMRTIAVHFPRQVVEQGGFTMLLLAKTHATHSIIQLYDGAVEQPQGRHEALAYMHCRIRLPDNADAVMRDVMEREPAGIRVLFANAYDLARDTATKPQPPRLPDLDADLEGAIYLVPADSDERTKVLLAPMARAAGFIAAHKRQSPEEPIEVPLHAKHMPALLKALLYDELPVDDTEALAALAELANMWCAPRLAHLVVDALTLRMGFFDVADVAGDWASVRELMHYHAIEFLPCLAKEDRVAELADILWTCK